MQESPIVPITKGSIKPKPSNLKIGIADICCQLVVNDPNFAKRLKEKYRQFLSTQTPSFYAYLRLKERLGAQIDPQPEVSFQNGKIKVTHRDFLASFDFSKRRGEIFSPRELTSVENFLRVLYSFLIVDHDGFLLHAAGVVNGEKGYVFFGKSGTGKTTVARLSTDYTLLSDDLLMVKSVDGIFKVFATPFGGELRSERKNTVAAIDGFFLLKKDQSNHLKKVNYSKAIVNLLQNIVCFTKDQQTMRKLFNLACDCLTKRPCYEMHFLPDKSFWRCINALT
jgi:hypothetical protein